MGSLTAGAGCAAGGFLLGLAGFQRLADHCKQPGQGNGFLDEVVCSQARGFNGGFNRAMTGHDHHRAIRSAAGGPLFKQRDSIDVRHPNVEQYEIRFFTGESRSCCCPILRYRDRVALILQDFAHQFPDIRFIIND